GANCVSELKGSIEGKVAGRRRSDRCLCRNIRGPRPCLGMFRRRKWSWSATHSRWNRSWVWPNGLRNCALFDGYLVSLQESDCVIDWDQPSEGTASRNAADVLLVDDAVAVGVPGSAIEP